jgi:two-component system cell cycle sensor histidine kinase/response regulator CckA
MKNETLSPRTVPNRPGQMPRGTETVLLVEDDETVRRVTRMILEDLGYRLLTAESGPHASKLNRSFRGEIHLLLSDIMMPGGNGVEWARRIRRDRPSLSTLFMSAYTPDALRKEGVPDPGPHFLHKPFGPDLLALKIREILDSQAAEA